MITDYILYLLRKLTLENNFSDNNVCLCDQRNIPDFKWEMRPKMFIPDKISYL